MISQTAVVETSDVGAGTNIGEFAVVRAGVRLGEGVVVHPHVVIEPGVVIADGTEVFPGTYIGKEPKGAGATARLPEFEKKVTIGANCSIGPNAVIYYDVSIGEHTLVGDGVSIREQCAIGRRCVVGMHVSVDRAVEISDRVKIMDLTHVVGKTLIEEDAFIAPGVSMANDPFIGTRGFEEKYIRGVTLRKGAVVGVGATLLPGVEIGERAAVAAGALVDRDVPAHRMAAGSPAKHYKKIPAKLIQKFNEPESSSGQRED